MHALMLLCMIAIGDLELDRHFFLQASISRLANSIPTMTTHLEWELIQAFARV